MLSSDQEEPRPRVVTFWYRGIWRLVTLRTVGPLNLHGEEVVRGETVHPKPLPKSYSVREVESLREIVAERRA